VLTQTPHTGCWCTLAVRAHKRGGNTPLLSLVSSIPSSIRALVDILRVTWGFGAELWISPVTLTRDPKLLIPGYLHVRNLFTVESVGRPSCLLALFQAVRPTMLVRWTRGGDPVAPWWSTWFFHERRWTFINFVNEYTDRILTLHHSSRFVQHASDQLHAIMEPFTIIDSRWQWCLLSIPWMYFFPSHYHELTISFVIVRITRASRQRHVRNRSDENKNSCKYFCLFFD